jgi:hypothetical protein
MGAIQSMESFDWEFLYELGNGDVGSYVVKNCVSQHEAEQKLKLELKDKPKKLANILDCLIEVESYER